MTDRFGELPSFAAFRHCDARDGFEVVFFRSSRDAIVVRGHTSAVEDGQPFAVAYSVELDRAWRTRRAEVRGTSLTGSRTTVIEADGEGAWSVDGAEVAALAGCLDLDLESSALTNAFPVRRLGLGVGERAPAPAAYVRALDLSVGRLEQTYERLADPGDGRVRFDYSAPAFDFRCELDYDACGLVVAYPGIAVRSA
jgi:hypothetical protein